MALDDSTLLKRWTTRRDVEAFDEIVGRFADPVFGTCRRILRNDADAEEITQECFLLLVRSGGEIHSSLGGWLHRVATTKSLDRIRREIHRRERERVFEEGAELAVELAWDDIQEHVDAAIDTLPDETRDVIVAHFLQRKTHEEIASERAVTRRAISYRIERGIESIRRELRRRGVVVSVASLGASLAVDASAAPLSLKASLGKLAIAAGTTSGAGGASTTSSLLGSLILMKAKSLTIAGILIAFVAGTCFVLMRTPEVPSGEAVPEVTGSSGGLEATTSPEESPAPGSYAAPAADTETPSLTELLALSHGELERALEYHPPIEDPALHASVSGIVLDKNAYPVPGAAVALVPTHNWGILPGAGAMARTATSGADGVYQIAHIKHGGDFSVAVAKDGFASVAQYAHVELGKDVTVDFALEEGLSIQGRVVSAAGEPVPDAYLYCVGLTGQRKLVHDLRRATQTDRDGHFTFGFPEEQRGFVTSLRVQSSNHGRATFPDILVQNERPVELRLAAPAVIRGTVKDRSGKLLSGARVTFFALKTIDIQRDDGEAWSSPSFAGNFVAICDGSGRYATEVDIGLDFQAKVDVQGFDDGRERGDQIAALASGETREYNAVFNTKTITVRASFVGQQSGQPFSGHVDIQAVAFKDGQPVATSQPDGPLARRFTLPRARGKYTFQAHYYYDEDIAGHISAPHKLKGGDDIVIELDLPDPQSFLVRTVDAGGRPVEGASVKFSTDTWGGNPLGYGQTNADGRLNNPILLPPMSGAQLLVEKPGYAMARGPIFEDQSPGMVHPEETVVLWSGAGFEGNLVDGDGKPLANTALSISITNGQGENYPVTVNTDVNGHFTVIDQAPADVVDIWINTNGGGEWFREQLRLEANAITGLGEISME